MAASAADIRVCSASPWEVATEPGLAASSSGGWTTRSSSFDAGALMMNAAGAGPGYHMLQGESGVTRCLLPA